MRRFHRIGCHGEKAFAVDLDSIEPPVIIAHRGYSARYPENTLAAFGAALDAGADMVEMDVWLTKDGEIAVLHDDTLDRTTSGEGPVAGWDIASLRQLEAGGWFHPYFYGEGIPTLAEALDLIGSHAGVNIEIKSSMHDMGRPAGAIGRQVADLVTGLGLCDSVIISSFEWDILDKVAGTDNAPRIALLSEAPADEDGLAACKGLGAYSWHQNHKTLAVDQVATLHAAGLRAFAYTVNSQMRFRKLTDMGVDGVFTDNPMGLRFNSPVVA